MDLDPHILQLEPPVHYHNLFGCCCYWPIVKSARLVAFFSLVSFFINLIFFITAGDYRALHLIIEIFVLFVEFVAVIFLFYGISHKKASYLKPYLLCGIIWNAFLFILWLLCLIQLFDKRGFHYEVLSNISVFVHIDADIQTIETTGFWLSISLLIGLGVTIAVSCWFLHIVLSTYYYFDCRHKEIWDQQAERKQLLTSPPTNTETEKSPTILNNQTTVDTPIREFD
ncbi:hypothetical protein M3Y96_00343800 [Aphelenchoides besseyi]|nr:hypothetical protein M3Y96_00343800 [Aphelenchoides besseyi]